MKTLLRIDASSRVEGSHSRALADYTELQWKKKYPGGKIVLRDLVSFEIPHIHHSTIQGFYTPAEHMTDDLLKATALSDELIAELKQADEVLISSPLYNLNIPSSLKAYIDQITRVNHTFQVSDDGVYAGLLNGKIAYLALVKGGSYAGTPMEAYDFQSPYLKAILYQLGIVVKNTFSLEGATDAVQLQQKLPIIHQQINQAFDLQAIEK